MKRYVLCTEQTDIWSEKIMQVTFTKFTSTIPWDDSSKIHNLFAVLLKLLRGPQGDRGPQFENH